MAGNEKFWKIYLKKLFSQNVWVFIDLFYKYHYPLYFIYSNCMWRHVCTTKTCNSIILHSLQKKKLIFFYKQKHPSIGVLRKRCSKNPCRSVISISCKATLLKSHFRHGCSPVNLLHISRTPFYKSTSEGLLLCKEFFK